MNLSSANNRIRHNATELKKLGFTVFFTLYGTGE